jgi:hypothetical protein
VTGGLHMLQGTTPPSGHTAPKQHPPAADKALHVVHRTRGVHSSLVLGCISYQPLRVCEGHIGRCDAVALRYSAAGRGLGSASREHLKGGTVATRRHLHTVALVKTQTHHRSCCCFPNNSPMIPKSVSQGACTACLNGSTVPKSGDICILWPL